ncbi:hypothetical protein [Sphingomonas sp. NPDC079357]|uniref:hypothetical protein n=1 Tax=Sphingomonas sp. NPDC079357 TaxID=3364518 RepID=UPI003850080E
MTNDIFILVVEDETLIEEIVVSGLEDAGYTVVAAHTAEDAIAQLEKAILSSGHPGDRHRCEPCA